MIFQPCQDDRQHIFEFQIFKYFSEIKNDESNKPISQKDSLAKLFRLFNVHLYCI